MTGNRKWLSDEQVLQLNERHGWFKHGDAQSAVSRAFANDAVEAHERIRAAAPDLLEALTWVRDNPDDNAYWLAKVDSAIAKATGTP